MFDIRKKSGHPIEVTIKFQSFKKTLLDLEKQGEERASVMLEIFNTFGDRPTIILNALNLTLHQYFKADQKILLTIENFCSTAFMDVKANFVDNFVTFEAIIVRVHQPKLAAKSIDFLCSECKAVFTHYLIDGNYTSPGKCYGKVRKECKGKSFIVQKESMKGFFVQRIKIQEIDAEGRVPRQLNC